LERNGLRNFLGLQFRCAHGVYSLALKVHRFLVQGVRDVSDRCELDWP
jgi:hypothetical protein